MVKVNEVAFFVYPVTDIARSRKFYEGILGLKPGADYPPTAESKWIEYDVNGVTFGIGCSEKFLPSRDGAMAALEVDNFDDAVANLKAGNIEFFMGPMETPVCHMAMFRDPDGSPLCLHRRKTK